MVAGHDSNIRSESLLRSAIENTRQNYLNGYEIDLFSLGATYIQSIAMNHPFVDGNKRAAALAALVFLEYNGYQLEEKYDAEFAEQILCFINKKITKKDLAKYLEDNSQSIE